MTEETVEGRRILYIEPVSGISGDMFLGALLDLGVSLEQVRAGLSLLPAGRVGLSAREVSRAGVRALKFDVEVEPPHTPAHGAAHHSPHAHEHRRFRDIRQMIETSGLPHGVKQRSVDAFTRLAVAEGRVHGMPPEDVAFHEVGAIDSIVDIVGAMIALETLLPLTILSSEVNTGRGTLTCRHGVYPVPGPATQELLRGVPVFSNEVEGELTTPTGAALLATLVEGYGPRPAMTVTRSGYGAGSRDTPGSANVLRVSLGSDCRLPGAGLPEDEVAVLETSLDDHSPQTLGHLQEMLLGAGALDVCLIPAQMKKNRPGVMLTVLAPPDREAELARLIFAETTTLGLRRSRQRRFVLERRTAHVETEYGPVGVKCSGYGGRVINCTPEYEDCRRVALERNVALREVMSAAAAAGRRLLGAAGPPSDSGPVTEG